MKPLRLMAALLQRLVDKIDPHEGRYRMLFERSPLPMWVVDTETLRFLAVNDAALRLYEYSREEFLALTAREIGPTHDHAAFRDFLSREAEVQHGHFRHLKKTGEPIDIEAVGHLVAWRGRPARLVQINDITERLRTQQTLERLNRELEVSHERLRALSRRLFEVQEEERKRLARDLHDDVGQALTALKIQLESLARPGGELAPRSRVDEIVDTVQHTLERVRQLSLSLRPPQLDDLGLAAALRSHLDRQARVAGLQAHFEAEDAPPALAPDAETACFRVAQEAINNVLRHARARNLWVRLFTAGGRLAISVRDDGRGFDLDAVRARAANGASLGLVGMEERMALAGGSFELRSTPGQGTVLLATFPMATTGGKERAVG
jgi:two-component system sensor histidine kinase UhpB